MRREIAPKNDDSANTSTSIGLCSLPVEMIGEICSHLPPQHLGMFARTSKQMKAHAVLPQLLQASIYAASESYTQTDLTRLAAIALLKKHPELLFEKGKVTDHYGRVIFGSSYQALLGAGDVWAITQIHEEILNKIEDSAARAAACATAQAQFREQFPNYDKDLADGEDEEARLYDARNIRQVAEIKSQLAIVKQCIAVDSFNKNNPNKATCQAVKTLCQLFQPMPEEIIRSGLHFPLAIIKEIYEIYAALQGQKRMAFYSLKVIKPALDALSTVDEQCCLTGLQYLNMEIGPNRRSNESRYQYPLGKPLLLRRCDERYKQRGFGVAALVDPSEGNPFFCSSDYIDGLNTWESSISITPLHQEFTQLMSSKSSNYSKILHACELCVHRENSSCSV